MTTRREFIEESAGAVAGLAFVTCGLTGPASAEAQAQPRRREVVVNGRRVKTVDVHAHCSVPEAMALMGLKVSPPTLLMSNAADRIRAMDEQGIDVEALSINPYWYKADRDVARQLIRIQNEKLAEACAANPERFVAFASVALQHPGPRRRAARGRGQASTDCAAPASAAASTARSWPTRSSTRSGPRPSSSACSSSSTRRATARRPTWRTGSKGNGGLDNVIGNPLETTIALSHLIFEGTLDRFPGLKICAAHGGGYLPSYAARSDAICTTFPDRCTTPLKKKPTEYLRQLYYDSIVFTPEALRHLVAETGSGQIVMGTDYPFPWTQDVRRPHPRHAGPERRRAHRDARRDRREAPGNQVVADRSDPLLDRHPPVDAVFFGRIVAGCPWYEQRLSQMTMSPLRHLWWYSPSGWIMRSVSSSISASLSAGSSPSIRNDLAGIEVQRLAPGLRMGADDRMEDRRPVAVLLVRAGPSPCAARHT